MNALTIGTVIAAFLLCLVLVYAARTLWSPDENSPRVKVLGAYSPVLTWIKYRRLPKIKGASLGAWLAHLMAPISAIYARLSARLKRIFMSTHLPALTKPPESELPQLAFASPPEAASSPPADRPGDPLPGLAPELAPPAAGEDEAEKLRRELSEMHAHVAALEAELTRLRPRPFGLRKKMLPIAMTAAVIVFAAIPPALVFQHRWLNDGRWVDYFRAKLWCRVGFLCETALPSYFVVIFACFAALLVLIFWQKTNLAVLLDSIAQPETRMSGAAAVGMRQARFSLLLLVVAVIGFAAVVWTTWPNQDLPGWNLILVLLAYMVGWFLREVPLGRLAGYWRQNYDFVIAFLLAHFSLIAALAGYYSIPQYFWAGLLLLALAFGNLLRYFRRVNPIYWIVSAALVLSTLHINGWWTSVIGDDFGFHDLARQLAERTSLLDLGNNLFNAKGLFDTHPLFTSYVQAVFVRFLGHDSFGWRFSNVYLCAAGAALFYLFLRNFVVERVALIAAVFLAVSHYVMSFSKIGYNNLQALFVLSLNLCVAAWALRSKRPLAYAALGAALASCFYSYPAALYVLPYPVLLLLLYDPPRSRATLGRWAVMLSVLAMVIYPLFLQSVYWRTKIDGTIFNRADLVQSTSVVVQHFVVNFLYSAFSFLYIPQETHYVSSSFVDPLTGVLASIGMLLLLKQSWRQRFAAFGVIGFLGMVISAGTTHDRDFPPVTRMFLILPWLALFAAYGLVWIEERLKNLGVFSPRVMASLASVLLVAMTGLNLYQAYDLSYYRFAGRAQIEQLFMRIAQKVYQLAPDRRVNYVVILDSTWSIAGLVKFQEVYPLYLESARLSQVKVDGPALPEASKLLLQDSNTLILILPWLDKGWQQGLEAPLRELGKEPCTIYTADGQPRFTLYHAPDLTGACQ